MPRIAVAHKTSLFFMFDVVFDLSRALHAPMLDVFTI